MPRCMPVSFELRARTEVLIGVQYMILTNQGYARLGSVALSGSPRPCWLGTGDFREHLLSVARRRSSKPFCARRVCLCLEQAKQTSGIGWGVVMTCYVSHGTFTEGQAEGGICRQIPECLRQGNCIARRNRQARFSVADNLRNRRHIRRDDRHSRGARLREHHRQTVPEGGQGEDIAAMVEILQRLTV